MTNLRKPFPILEQYTYLNTAASGLLSERVLEFRQDHDLDFLIKGSILKESQGKLLGRIRETVGSFFGCEANRVALVSNFSTGFNTLLEGIDKSKTFLLLQDDYPSINWAVTSREFKTWFAKIDENVEEHIEKALREYRPDFFAFSIVQYISGIKISQDQILKWKKEFPETIFIADGTQYCGTEKFDFDSCGIDILIASCYKWLNAGYGNGFMLFKPEIPQLIFPKFVGYNSLQGKYKAHEGNFLGKFEPGHQDTLNHGSLMTALQLLKDVGMETVEDEIKKLSEVAKLQFEELGLLHQHVVKRDKHSSIFNLKGDANLLGFLKGKDIIASPRGEGVRVSFHYFNTFKELNIITKALKEYYRK